MIQVPAPANSFTDARFATWLIKHFQIPIRGIQPGPSQSRRSSPDTHCKLVSYPPNLESTAAPATAFATSSWPRSGCEMVSRPTALVRRPSAKADHCAAGRCGHCSKAAADRGTTHSWSAWPSHTRCHACGTARAKLAGVSVAGHTGDTIGFQQRREVIDHRAGGPREWHRREKPRK